MSNLIIMEFVCLSILADYSDSYSVSQYSCLSINHTYSSSYIVSSQGIHGIHVWAFSCYSHCYRVSYRNIPGISVSEPLGDLQYLLQC